MRGQLYEYYGDQGEFYRDISIIFNKWKIYNTPEDLDSSMALSKPIKNGTLVTIRDDPVFDYEWRDGQVRKRISQQILANLDNLELAKETHWSIVIAIIVAACLLLIVAYCIYLQRRSPI